MKRNHLSLAIGLTLSLAAVQAQAQSAPAAAPSSEAVTLDAVQVTARKREETLQEVPVAVTAFTDVSWQRLVLPRAPSARLRQALGSLQRRLRHLAPVQVALGGGAHVERRVGPDRAGVELTVGLQHGHAPVRLAVAHRPVQRARPLVAGRAGVHHETGHALPDRGRDAALEERRQHQVGPGHRHRLFGHAVGDVQLDTELVAARAQLGVQALAEAVEAVAEQQDAQGHGVVVRVFSGAGRRSRARPACAPCRWRAWTRCRPAPR